MDEVSGPVIAVALVLSAVFIPCAFITGITGQFFRQFALTIAVSTIISAFNSLTLSPALAALLLRPRTAKRDPLTWLSANLVLGWFFWLFNLGFNGGDLYAGGRAVVALAVVRVLVVYGGLLSLTGLGLFGTCRPASSPPRTKATCSSACSFPTRRRSSAPSEVMARSIEKIAKDTPGVKNVNSVAGNSFLLSAYGSNFGSMFIILDEFFSERGPGLNGDAIAAELKKFAMKVPEAICRRFRPARRRRPGPRRRLQADGRGPRRRGPAVAAGAKPTT